MVHLVSIIITVFNEGLYLEKCLLSVLGQTYRNLEIIVVDDGSEDDSLKIINEFRKIDTRIAVVSKENGGKVSALKAGVKCANGDYVVTIDGDDWIDSTMIESMLAKAVQTDSDIVQCGIEYVYTSGGGNSYEEPLFEGYYELENSECILYNHLFWSKEEGADRIRSNVCSCLIRRDLFCDVQLNIPEIICNGEDDACFYSMILRANSFYFLHDALYCHLIRDDSMGRSPDQYSLEQIVALDGFLYPQVDKHWLRDKLVWRYRQYFAFLMQKFLSMTHSIHVEKHYDFIFDKRLVGKKVVIYGAGKVGKSVIIQNQRKHWFTILLWVDKKGEGDWEDYHINSIESMKEVNYDYVLLAILDGGVAEEIRKSLLCLGVMESKIIWNEPSLSDFSYYVDTDSD